MLVFDPSRQRSLDAVALTCDLQGFTAFCNEPDAVRFTPVLLNAVATALNGIFVGAPKAPSWSSAEPSSAWPSLTRPPDEKFLGDGALYVWTIDHGRFNRSCCLRLCQRLRMLQKGFPALVRDLHIPRSSAVPQRIRFGLAAGTVIELNVRGTQRTEYVGVCINLASRLQSYCRPVGFIASARIPAHWTLMARCGFVKVIAHNLPGFGHEEVFVDKEDFERLPDADKERLFLPSMQPEDEHVDGLEATVRDLVCHLLDVEPDHVTRDASFVDDLKADSLGIVELIHGFEEWFDVDIHDEDAERLRTFGDAVEYMRLRVTND